VSELGPMPRIHQRERNVQVAEQELRELVISWYQKLSLTSTEVLSVLVNECGSGLRYLMRKERHPDDPSKPAGLE
jgi:hypothetical protein